MCNKLHKYFVVKMEGGISDKKFVRVFAEPPDNDVKKLFIGIFLPTL